MQEDGKAEPKLIFVAGFPNGNERWLDDGKSFSRNFRQGYRVYDARGIANSITANGGGLGGHSGIYLVRRIIDE